MLKLICTIINTKYILKFMSKLTKKWHSKTSKLLNIFKSNFKSLFLKTKKPYIITPLIIGTLTLVSFVGYKFIQAAAIPEVSISGTNTPLIGETFSTQISFNNAGNDAGFGPFIDVILPRNGSDGVFPYNPGFEADGITFNSATIDSISSTPVLSTTFPDDGAGTGCVNHPLAVDSSNSPRSVCGTAGDIYLVFILPFGSYVSDQPTSTLNLSLAISNLADISTPLDIIATGGFRFGADSLNNPSTDPSIYTPYDVSLPQPSEWATHSVSPSLVTVNNFDNPPENEIPSGPNSPQTYTSQIQVASGQTIGESGNPSNNVIFTNTLSDKVTYQSPLLEPIVFIKAKDKEIVKTF